MPNQMRVNRSLRSSSAFRALICSLNRLSSSESLPALADDVPAHLLEPMPHQISIFKRLLPTLGLLDALSHQGRGQFLLIHTGLIALHKVDPLVVFQWFSQGLVLGFLY